MTSPLSPDTLAPCSCVGNPPEVFGHPAQAHPNRWFRASLGTAALVGGGPSRYLRAIRRSRGIVMPWRGKIRIWQPKSPTLRGLQHTHLVVGKNGPLCSSTTMRPISTVGPAPRKVLQKEVSFPVVHGILY